MRVPGLIPAFGVLLFLAPMPAEAGDATGTGVTVWRGAPGAWQGNGAGQGDRHGLADWIRDWHGRIEPADISPIPKDIHKRFRHAFPAGLFDWARFGVVGDERLWRQACRRGFGTPSVIVLDDLILFRSADAALSHAAWYQGLEQAQAFRRHGVEKTAGSRQAKPTVRRLGPRHVYTYPYRFLYPRWRSPQGRPDVGDGGAALTVPGQILIQPKNPFANE